MIQAPRTSIVASVLALLLLALSARVAVQMQPSSFKAFYCGGRSVLDGVNPYAIEPLRECEHRVAAAALPPYAVEPAPLPGYALVPWALVATLAPAPALWLYFAILVLALASTSWAIGKLAALDPALVALSLFAVWFLNVSFNELPPIATAGIALAALMLAQRRPWLAALAAGAVAIEPHLALPLWISLFCFAPSLRLPLISVGAALALADLAIGGPATALGYFAQTLPAQAFSEVYANDQYSLTHLAAAAGVGASTALRIGVVSYLLMAGAGIVTAQRIARQSGSEYLALVPPAFVLVGGTFLHDIQFMAALPLALVLLGRTPAPNRVVAVAAILLAVAWNEATSRFFLLLSATSAFVTAWIAFPKSARRVAVCASVAVVAAVMVVAVNRLPAAPGAPLLDPPAAAALAPGDQAARAWSLYVTSSPALSTPTARTFARKLPTWTGACLLAAFCIAYGRRRPAS
jgi:hypothetical protein